MRNSGGGGGLRDVASRTSEKPKKKGKVEAYDANILSHVQSAIVKFELHHDILKKTKDIHIQTLTMLTSHTSVQIVDLGNCGF